MLINAAGVLLFLVPFVVLPLIYTGAGRGIPDRGWIAFASLASPVWGLDALGDLDGDGVSFWLVAKLIFIGLLAVHSISEAVRWRAKQSAARRTEAQT